MFYIVYFVLFLLLVSIGYASLSLAPWLPTRRQDLARIFALADLRPGEIFYDLGCGDGKVVIYGARHYPQARFIGLELALPFYFLCRLRQRLKRNGNVAFRFKNLFKENLSGAGAVYMFAASPEKQTEGIADKLKRELKPGARVVTYAFPIKGWQPIEIDKPAPEDIAIYLYRI